MLAGMAVRGGRWGVALLYGVLSTLLSLLDPAALSGPGGLALLLAAACAALVGFGVRRYRLLRHADTTPRNRPRVVGRRAEPGYYLPLSDPGAPGRPRPRAPGAVPATA